MRVAAGATVVLALAPGSLRAQSTWTGTTATYGDPTNWTAGAPTAAGQSAVFDSTGTATTITVTGSIAPDSWIFTSHSQAYTLTGGTVNFSLAGPNGGVIVNPGVQPITIDSIIGGAGAQVHLNSAGGLVLSGTNTYGGGTTITSGALQVTNSNAVGTGAVTLDGGTFQQGGGGGLTFTNDVRINTAGGTIDNGGTNLSLTGTISNGNGTSGVLTFAGGGETSLSGTNTYSGGTLLGSFGIVLVGNNSAFGTGLVTLDNGLVMRDSSVGDIALANNFRITSNGAILDADGGNLTISGNISGPGSLQAQDITSTFSHVILTGTNSYSGGTTICACATLVLGDGGTSGSITGDVANGGVLMFNRSNTYLFAGKISDDGFDQGAVVQFGSGTTILTADNTYTNGTFVQNGRLIVGNGGTTGSIIGGVQVDAGAVFGVNRSDTVTLTNPIGGGGGFAQLGTGTTIFLGGKTYTGTTTIAAGTLQIGNGGSTGTIGSGDIVDNGVLAIDKTNAFTLNNNNISGTGGLNQIGSGTTTLNGITTYSGPTSVTAGILRAGAVGVFSASSAFNVGASGTLNLSGFNQTIGSLTGSGPVLLSSATLTAGNDGTTTTYTGVIQGAGGLSKIGGGNFILSGTNSYGGPTTVVGGILSVNGSIASSSGVAVNTGGQLGGTGQLPSVTINGGVLAPGNSIGTITINGSLVVTAASTYLVEVSPAAADRTNVTGAATLAGTVSLAVQGAPNFGMVYTILSATGGRNGTFGALAYSNPLVTAVLNYTATDVVLSFSPNLTPFIGTTTNQRAAGSAVQNGLNGRDAGAFAGLFALAPSTIPAAITQLTGELGTGLANASLLDMEQFLHVMLDPYVDGRNAAAGAPTLGYAAERKAGTDAFNQLLGHDRMATKAPRLDAYAPRWTLWGGAYGASGTLRGDPNSAGSQDITARNAGFAVGADYLLRPDTIAGFALTGSGITYGLAGGLGSGSGDAVKGGAYLSQRFGNGFISASFAVGRTDARTDRFAVVGGVFDHLTASPTGTSIGGRLEAGYRVGSWLNTAIVPYAALQAQAFRTNAYSETDASGLNAFALNYGATNQSQVRSELGSRFDFGTMTLGTATLSWRARAAWAHDYSSAPSIGAAFQALPGANFTVIGAQRARDAALVSIGPQLEFAGSWSLRAKFDGEFASRSQIYAGTGTLRYSW